jgi:thiamine-phosphate pyrophosphorylase
MELARACLRGGARLLQLRVKEAGSAGFLRLAEALTALAREHDGSLVVNDRADIARLAGAAGVHVGQEDMPPADVRQVVGSGAIVGLSTHDEAQVAAALREPITYVAVGPVYSTETKRTGYDGRGLDLVRVAARGPLPVVAIGGITLERVGLVIGAGAAAVAVISDLFTGGNPEARAHAYLAAIAAAGRDPAL